MACTICMLVTNPATNDPRVGREASSLRHSGFNVVIVGVETDDGLKQDSIDGCQIVRVAHPKWILRRARLSCRAVWAKTAGRMTLNGTCREGGGGAIPPGKSQWTVSSDLWRGGRDDSPRTRGRRLWADLLNILNVAWLNVSMARVAVGQKADIYHSHDLDTLLAGCIAKRMTRAKLVYDFHELFTEQYRPGAKTWVWKTFYAALERLLIKQADLKLTVCDSIARWVSQRYGTNHAVTVRNCPPAHDLRVVATQPSRERVVLYHGAFIHDRGIEQLIESAQYLSRARIVLRGIGPLEGYFRALVLKKGVEKKVTFEPAVSVVQLVTAAAQADIGAALYLPVCLNARFSLPNKLFEYMMAGLAVVGSDLPELREVILSGGHPVGTVCNPGDPHDLARAVNELTDDDALLDRLKRNARAAATSIYNWESEGCRLLEAYAALTAR